MAQIRNLELEGLKRLIPEVAGSNPAPGTKNSIYSQLSVNFLHYAHVQEFSEFYVNFFQDASLPKAFTFEKRYACFVARGDYCNRGVKTRLPPFLDKCLQELSPDSFSLMFSLDIQRNLRGVGVSLPSWQSAFFMVHRSSEFICFVCFRTHSLSIFINLFFLRFSLIIQATFLSWLRIHFSINFLPFSGQAATATLQQ